MSRTYNIELQELKLLDNAGSLRALACVKIDDIEIHQFRVVQQDGQDAWVSVPQASWIDSETGEKRYKNLVEMPSDLHYKVKKEIMNAYQKQHPDDVDDDLPF
jgi:DNA-binding cell septation regulator SpoVG